MSPSVMLCVDAGTSATKVAVVDEFGSLLATASRGYGLSHPHPGWVEQNPDEMFQAAVDAMAEVVAKLEDVEVVALSCSAQRATWVGLGPDLDPTSAYIGWQDARAVAEVDELHSRFGPAYAARTGMRIDTVSALPKMLWSLRHDTSPKARTQTLAAHQTLLLAQLGVSEPVVSASEASYLGLLDVTTRNWTEDVAAEVGIDTRRLPRIVESGTIVGRLAAEVATRVGLAQRIPIVMGGGDLQLGALGVGAGDPGVVAVGIGTGGGCVAPTAEPATDPAERLNCLAHVVPGLWEVEGLGSAAGGSLRWLRETIGEPEASIAAESGRDTYDLLIESAMAEPRAPGIVVVPALAGLGAPYHDSELGGLVVGLRLHHRRGDLIRAFIEGIALEQRTILDTVREVVGQVDEVRLWGGAARSDEWCQLQVDTYGVRGARCEVTDASLIGAAICAAVGVGLLDDFPTAVRSMTHPVDGWEPDPARHQEQLVALGTYRAAIDAMANCHPG